MATEVSKNTDPVPRLAFSIDEFCQAHGISSRHYYNMRDRGAGPREMHVGGRVAISVEAAAGWRRAMETAA